MKIAAYIVLVFLAACGGIAAEDQQQPGPVGTARASNHSGPHKSVELGEGGAQ